MQRRRFLQQGLLGAAGIAAASRPELGFDRSPFGESILSDSRPLPLIRSITPVVGDGHWIWNEPPEQTGYLHPRDYELEIGIELEGTGPARMLRATTPVPVELPEQTIEAADITAIGCRAVVRSVSPEAAQLFLNAPTIARGQTLSARYSMKLQMRKQYQGFEKEQFGSTQPDLPLIFRQQFLFDSPGIQTRASEVKKLQREIAGTVSHPWDAAYKFYQWVWDNIEPRIGIYTSVVRALRDRVGDCEERAAVFVALCRAAGIPARLVWVPNHNWAEFFLVDGSGKGYWIPAHTAAYSWFGWTGAHELVIQKGDRLFVPEKKQPQRLLGDWFQWQGSKPKARFTARIRPLSAKGDQDAGPGARSKDPLGKWVLAGDHPLDTRLRDGDLTYPRPHVRES